MSESNDTLPGGHGEEDLEPWRRERYGSLQDQDKVGYGSGYDPEAGEYGQGEDAVPRPEDEAAP